MQLTSPAFIEGQSIPVRHTGQGLDHSPPLAWTNVPAATVSFALICDDPDAPVGTWVHWLIQGIPATAAGLPEGVLGAERLPDGSRQGRNDFGRIGYGGPMPPPGKPHRYIFALYALDTGLALSPGFRKADLLKAMEGHVLAEARLMGVYQRR